MVEKEKLCILLHRKEWLVVFDPVRVVRAREGGGRVRKEEGGLNCENGNSLRGLMSSVRQVKFMSGVQGTVLVNRELYILRNM